MRPLAASVTVLGVLPAVVAACVREAPPPAVYPIGWETARPLGRAGPVLSTVLSDGTRLDLRLDRVGVFDCRTDCWRGVGEDLAPLAPGDTLCIGFLYLQDGRQVGKVWVERPVCARGAPLPVP